MKMLLMVACGIAASLGSAATQCVWQSAFADRSDWPICEDYDKSVRFEFGVPAPDGRTMLTVTGTATGKCDTAWRVRSARVPLPRRAPKFELSFAQGARNVRCEYVSPIHQWMTQLVWYDADGREVGRRQFDSGLRPGDWRVRLVDDLPPDAAAFELQLGFDAPELPKGTEIRFSDLSFSLAEDDAVCGFWGGDASPPRVSLASASPTEDPLSPVAFSLSDETGVAWERTTVAIDGKDMTAAFRRTADGFALERPGQPWKAGLHTLVVKAVDILGNSGEAHKVFFIGKAVTTPKVTLRDDGVTLVDGQPFFPVGIYNVKRHVANGRDFDRAFADLGKAGFNFANSYRESLDPEFAAAARRHGFRLFEDAKRIRPELLEQWRNDPIYLAWYIGDDTADWNTPQMIRDRDENLRAVDGTRPTCQADWVGSPDAGGDRYRNFVGLTDIFMPELYPVHTVLDATNCVAQVIRHMKSVRRHHERDTHGRTCAIWPIVQNFKGWTVWKRFPTPEETTAMSFAALIHGAKGIIWYTYSSTYPPNPAKGRFDAGIADEPVAWNTATNLAQRISSLMPVLLARGDEAARVTVVSGPGKDVFGSPSVSGLVKHFDGAVYLLAVNSTPSPVRAKFDLAGISAEAKVLWENRRVACAQGTVTDDFAPFGVHVYSFNPKERK